MAFGKCSSFIKWLSLRCIQNFALWRPHCDSALRFSNASKKSGICPMPRSEYDASQSLDTEEWQIYLVCPHNQKRFRTLRNIYRWVKLRQSITHSDTETPTWRIVIETKWWQNLVLPLCPPVRNFPMPNRMDCNKKGTIQFQWIPRNWRCLSLLVIDESPERRKLVNIWEARGPLSCLTFAFFSLVTSFSH